MPAVPPAGPLELPTPGRVTRILVGKDGTMTSRKNLTAFVLVLAFVMTLVGMFLTTAPKATATGPYHSALSSVGVATAEAATCTNRACEFAHPGWFCDANIGTNCVRSGGCRTVACN
jgi:hypothetical protein